MKNFLRRCFNKFGIELTKTKRAYFKNIFSSNYFDHLIDVGANRGQFLSFARSTGYKGPATAFEPISEYRSDIEKVGNVRVFSVALGKTRGSRPLKIYSSTDFSSFHELNDRYKSNYCEFPVIAETRDVDVMSLDEIEFEGSEFALKIDAQGGDADVLRGAAKTLERVNVLILEMPFLQIYDEGCSVSELFALTGAFQLYPARFFPNSITNYGAWVDVDVVFVRKHHP